MELLAVSKKTQNPILKDFYLVPVGQGQNIIINKSIQPSSYRLGRSA
ncbi:hypothetical protein HP240_004443 [Salmonella enterica]|nr:hypothetical protein [Salmonella enterica]